MARMGLRSYLMMVMAIAVALSSFRNASREGRWMAMT